MLVVLALLNSYADLASAATGQVISTNVLLIAGAQAGRSSGLDPPEEHIPGKIVAKVV